MTKAPTGFTKPEAGVTATSPATSPEANPRAVGLPLCHHSATTHERAAQAAAACVARKAEAAFAPLAVALPALNPNQPNQSSPAPSSVITMLLGCMGFSG